MAKGKATTAKPRAASVTKVTKAASAVANHSRRFDAMDKLNRALECLTGTARSLYAVDTHMIGPNDADDADTCRDTLMRLLLADLGMVNDAERQAWRTVIGPGKEPGTIEGGAQ
jgi:hypothetical protein